MRALSLRPRSSLALLTVATCALDARADVLLVAPSGTPYTSVASAVSDGDIVVVRQAQGGGFEIHAKSQRSAVLATNGFRVARRERESRAVARWNGRSPRLRGARFVLGSLTIDENKDSSTACAGSGTRVWPTPARGTPELPAARLTAAVEAAS